MKKQYSLKQKQDFNLIFSKPHKRLFSQYFIFLWRWRDEDPDYLLVGLATAKQYKKAVERNKMKRIMRLFAVGFLCFKKKANVIIIVKASAKNIEKETLMKDFASLVSKTPFKIKNKDN